MTNARISAGMISAPQPEAVDAGLVVMEQGGNIMDAALTAAFVQTVVDPQMCGIAGFGCLQYYEARTGICHSLDFHGRAPAATTPDMWQQRIIRECDDGFGFVLQDQVNEYGYQSMTTPLTLMAFETARKRHASLSLGEIMAPAIRWAEEGFVIRPKVHAFWNQPAQNGRIARIRVTDGLPAAAAIYRRPDGSLWNIGEVLRNPDLGNTYRQIAENGIEVFYHGDIAAAIDADMRANGGLLSAADLADCSVRDSSALHGSYHGFEVITNPPPGGGLMILLMLNILENFDLAAMGHNSPQYIATVAEAMKLATIDKDARMGDPDFVTIPMAELMSKEYAASLAGRIRKGEIAEVPRLNSGAPESKETTHLCVADKQGNIVNITHSLGSSSGVVTPGLGFMYNNCMMVFDPRPGNPGSLAPGKARFTAMCPTMLKKDGGIRLALGAPGGTTITMGVLQAILNVVNFGMSAQEAVSAPRFCATSSTLELTNRIRHSTEAQLQQMGYKTMRYATSYATPLVHAIRITDHGMDGGADPAGDGFAAAV